MIRAAEFHVGQNNYGEKSRNARRLSAQCGLSQGNYSMIDIDVSKVTEVVERYICELIKTNSQNCINLGLSGGVDSAVLASLAVHAVGAERVKAYYLKDRDSEEDSEVKARILADWLGIQLEIQDISSAMHKKGVYSPLIMRLTPLARFFNRLFQHNYYLLFRELPHTSTLKATALFLKSKGSE